MSATLDTLVVGAGISGLAYAQARGPAAALLVLEASARPGGLIRTERGGPEGEYRFECGPEALTAGNDAVRELLAELELECEPIPATTRKRWVERNGRLFPVPTSPPAFLASPLLSPLGKLRALTEPLRAAGRGLDGSIAEFVEHRLGREVLERLVDPAVAGIHAGDPRALSMRACFPRLVELVERHGSLLRGLSAARKRSSGGAPVLTRPAGGVESLVRALAEPLGARLATGRPARALERAADGSWRLRTDAELLSARRVVLALPAPAAAELLAEVAPECSRELSAISAESMACVVHAWDRARVEHPLDGFGYLTPSSEPAALGTLFSSSIAPSSAPDGRVLLRTMIGGARDRTACDLTDDALLARAVDHARPRLGLAGRPLWSDVRRWPGALPSYDLEHPERLRRLRQLRPTGVELLGSYAGGIGLSALIEQARELAAEHSA